MDDRWLVVEIHRYSEGVRLHDQREARFIVGGDPRWKYRWARRGKPRPKWAIPTFDVDPSCPSPRVLSADLSKHGELALARRATYSGATQILDIRDGRLIAHIAVCPLAVGWSNDGNTLAVLEWLNPAWRHVHAPITGLDSVQLALYDRAGRKIKGWPLEFQASKFDDAWDHNAFVISWSRDDSWFLVSTKKALCNTMLPKLYLCDPRTGPVNIAAVSDAYFLGSARFVGNEQGEWSGASLFQVSEGHIRTERSVGRELFVAGSSAEEGVFLAYMPPGGFPMLRFALPVVLMDVEGKLVAKDKTGYAYGSSLRIVRSDAPLTEMLRTLLETDASNASE
jgi:hypothetical protein